jgi:hypothetical protein
MSHAESYTADPVRVLVEDADPIRRSRAHLELGHRAVARRDSTMAARHYREAATLDPTDGSPVCALHELGEPARTRRPTSAFGHWLFGFRRPS